jgi:hypothetical protein
LSKSYGYPKDRKYKHLIQKVSFSCPDSNNFSLPQLTEEYYNIFEKGMQGKN